MSVRKRSRFDFYFVLVVTFAVLKLTGQVDWTWWAVLVPLWIWLFGLALVLVLAVTGNLDD